LLQQVKWQPSCQFDRWKSYFKGAVIVKLRLSMNFLYKSNMYVKTNLEWL